VWAWVDELVYMTSAQTEKVKEEEILKRAIADPVKTQGVMLKFKHFLKSD